MSVPPAAPGRVATDGRLRSGRSGGGDSGNLPFVGGSALARTSAAFAAVTDGAYSLKVVDGPAGEALFATELAYPEEMKALTELSEGTRDQLYLALRMEALRGHCQSAMAVPFIADDILQTFDDGRAAAALQALCALSADLQVIVLTHHPHLQAIATGLGSGLGAVGGALRHGSRMPARSELTVQDREFRYWMLDARAVGHDRPCGR